MVAGSCLSFQDLFKNHKVSLPSLALAYQSVFISCNPYALLLVSFMFLVSVLGTWGAIVDSYLGLTCLICRCGLKEHLICFICLLHIVDTNNSILFSIPIYLFMYRFYSRSYAFFLFEIPCCWCPHSCQFGGIFCNGCIHPLLLYIWSLSNATINVVFLSRFYSTLKYRDTWLFWLFTLACIHTVYTWPSRFFKTEQILDIC